MEKNIDATLDLTKSLKDFEVQVTKLLELTNVSVWDGRIFKEREQKIRDAAIILAGQCIALFLYNLSQSQEALDTAINQTQGWWLPETKKHGLRKRQILTVGNVLVTLILPYVVTRTEKNDKNKSESQGFCPFQFGKIGINLRQSKILNRQLGNLPEGNVLKDQRVVIAVDGGRSKIRINKKGRKKSQTKRHGFIGQWIEPKLFTIYVVDEKCKKVKNSEIPITNDGTHEGYKSLLQILEAHLVDLGISQAKQVLLIADGAEWIWIHIPPLLTRLGCPLETYQLFDFYHVTENLKVFADAAFNEEAQSKQWFIKARKTLKKGNAKSLINQMDELIAVATGERCKIMVGKRNYLLDAYREGRLNYDKAIDKKLPIGSGAIESLIRQVVNLRIKGNSKFWLKENAEIMLHMRCQWMAGSWDNFCDSIFNSFIKPQTV